MNNLPDVLYHETSFQVRFYECDAYGHLNNANYLRYLQQAAFDASTALGWSPQRYEEQGAAWVLREVELEFMQPLYYGDTVTVQTWVTQIRRVDSTRCYEFRRGGEVVARATTLWVFLDRETMRLKRIPPEVRSAYAPDDAALSGETLPSFPTPPPQPSGTFHLQKRVEWRDIDSMNHVNSAAYFNYCEDASTQVGRHFGWSMHTMMNDHGLAMVMRRFRIQYQTSAVLDDTLDIATWLSDGRRATATRHYIITRDDGAGTPAPIARAEALWVCFDLERERPARFPTQMIADFETNIADD